MFCTIINSTLLADCYLISNIPGNYEILFLQGGGTGQFAAVPLNLTRGSEDVVDYLVTGQWSSKAAKEAEKYATVHYPFPKMESFTCIPPREEWQLSPNATYVYFCDNETVHGKYVNCKYDRETH